MHVEGVKHPNPALHYFARSACCTPPAESSACSLKSVLAMRILTHGTGGDAHAGMIG